MQLLRILGFVLVGVYFWLYPNIFLVPDEYRTGFWSVDFNVGHQGLIAGREIYEVKSLFFSHEVYRVTVLINGKQERFWVSSRPVFQKLAAGEMASFETRGRVVVLAKKLDRNPPISLLN